MALGTSKLANLIELGSEVWDEDINYITKVLEEAGNNINTAEQKLADLIRTAKADLAIEKGARLNEVYKKVKNELHTDIADNPEQNNYKAAARYPDNLTPSDKSLIKENLELLKRMEKQ